jgi:uncharacterized membrane protein YwzB
VRGVLGALAAFLLAVVFVSALISDPVPVENFAPTFIYVIFWLGVVPLVVLFGNVWAVLNPWRAVADAYVWARERAGVKARPWATYPERLGRWPAALLLFAFAALELAYWDAADPRTLAIATLIYSYVTWTGMAVFGRRAWLENGEAFSVYFGLLARLSVFATRETEEGRRIVIRPPLTGLSGSDLRPGTLAVIAVMLGSVSFDGFSRATLWQDERFQLISGRDPGLGTDLLGSAFNLAGLILFVLIVAVTYLAVTGLAQRIARDARPLAGEFLLSLVPIALAYAVAHYFSLLFTQGQEAIRLASDPFDRGWDLFGTVDYVPNLNVFSPNTIWYVQVGALVLGHVAGLILAHDRAVTLFKSSRVALRTQYAMLALMVLYTVGGLWLLSQG